MALMAGVASALSTTRAAAQWPQWGGADRDFKIDSEPLAETWPDAGPKQLWKRRLGDGFASIAVGADRLYTMYRTDTSEFSVALEARTGNTIWEVKQDSPFTDTMAEWGPGPHVTPLVTGDLVITIGTNGVMHAIHKNSGEVAWKHDLPAEFGIEIRARGYACNPIAYDDMVVIQGGAFEKKGLAVLAFDRETGSLRYKTGDFGPSYASPLLIRFNDQDQLLALMVSELVGLNPRTGEVLWQFEHKNDVGVNASMPLWDGRDTIFLSSAYDSGSRAVRLTTEDGRVVPKELWFTRKIRIHFGNAVLVGDHVYCSSGMGSALFGAVDIHTGDIPWRQRGFGRANVLHADGKLIILDEDGDLAIARAAPDRLEILARAHVAEPHAWAAPTLVDGTLYLRDRKHIMALDLTRR
jgi:outer membrane protein assembly factor BamB